MNSEELETLNNQVHSLKRDLEVMKSMESEFLYEIDILTSKNKKLKEDDSRNNETINKLNNKITYLNSLVDEVEFLRKDLDEKKSVISKLNDEVNDKLKQIKSLENFQRPNFESPTKALKIMEKKYNSEIDNLKSVNLKFENNCLVKEKEYELLKIQYDESREIMQSQINENKCLLEQVRQEKEELEVNLMSLQNEANAPDMNKHGNNLYGELDDRRVKAEKLLLEMQDKMKKQGHLTANLRIFLEHSFAAYSKLKETKCREHRCVSNARIKQLEEENEGLRKHQRHVSEYVEKQMSLPLNTYDQLNVINGLKLELDMLRTNNKYTRNQMKDCEYRKQKAETSYKNNLDNQDRLMKESVRLQNTNADLMAKLDIWDRLASEVLKNQFNKDYEELKEFWQKNDFMNTTERPNLLGIYGQTVNKNSKTLQFDLYGFPVENKLIESIREVSKQPKWKDVAVDCQLLTDIISSTEDNYNLTSENDGLVRNRESVLSNDEDTNLDNMDESILVDSEDSDKLINVDTLVNDKENVIPIASGSKDNIENVKKGCGEFNINNIFENTSLHINNLCNETDRDENILIGRDIIKDANANAEHYVDEDPENLVDEFSNIDLKMDFEKNPECIIS